MDSDDVLVGSVLSRRDAVRLLGATGLAIFLDRVPAGAHTAAAGAQGCVVRPELTEGPYYVDNQAVRSDIRSGKTGPPKAGVPLTLAFAVSQVSGGGCAPLPRATVDVWQCDALGVYSGVTDARYGFNTQGDTFLRGSQTTDASGTARFTTIYPGWYGGRAVHIHFKVRTQAPNAAAYEFTSQLFFPEEINDVVHAQPPYAQKGRRDTLNERDGIFRSSGGTLLVQPARSADGYAAQFALALDLSDAAAGRADGRGRGRGRRGGR